jgi:hydroxymethylbilane synthase
MKISDVPFENKSIFISRNLSPISPILLSLNTLGYEVKNKALIKFSQVRFTHTPPAQWVFFSGKNAIKYFFAQKPDVKSDVKFGVISSVSAEYLSEFNKKADFIGTGTDVDQIAKDFAGIIKNDSVLFPQSIDSLQTIQKHLSFTNTCHNLFVYKTTQLTDFVIPPVSFLVFTSPSNVQAYFAKYKLEKGQKVIAIGSTTRGRLYDHGIKSVAMPASFDELGLLACILEQLNEQPVIVPTGKVKK